jgi:hypothetical protein
MGEITADQLYTLFGSLKDINESQLRTLSKIESLVNDRFTNISDNLASLRASVATFIKSNESLSEQIAKNTQSTQSSNENLNNTQQEQVTATKKLDNTFTSGFKSLSKAFLTKENKTLLDRKPEKKEKKVELQQERLPTKLEKQSYKQLLGVNTNIGLLLKEVKQDKKNEQGGGLFKLLSPFLLLFGGIAALTYGIKKFPFAQRLLEDIKKSGPGRTIAGLINKIKPQDKTIMEWLRGLPLIGRFFDIYDAFSAFIDGDIKKGLKHLMFAIPGAEMIIELLGSTKKQFLSPGGARKTFREFSIQKLGENISKKFTDLFSSVTDFFGKIQKEFSKIMEGTWSGISSGLDGLSYYFPVLSPVVSFLSGITDTIFESAFAEAARGQKPTSLGPITLGDVIKTAMTNIYEGISKFFTKISDIFGKVGTIVSAIGNIFSGDYSKQAAALNTIDEFSPGVGSALRTALNLVDTIQQIGIDDNDGLPQIAFKLGKAALGITKSNKFSRASTFQKEAENVRMQGALDATSQEEKDKALQQANIKQTQASVYKEEETREGLKTKYEQANKTPSLLKNITKTIVTGAPWNEVNEENIGSIKQMLMRAGILAATAPLSLNAIKAYTDFNKVTSAATRGPRVEAIQDQYRESEKREQDEKIRLYRLREKEKLKSAQPLPERTLLQTPPSRELQQIDINKEINPINDRLKYLEELFLNAKEQTKILEAIKISNINMERMPVQQTSMIQGPTTNVFGTGQSSNQGTRGAFDQGAFGNVSRPFAY